MLIVHGDLGVNMERVTCFKKYEGEECYIMFSFHSCDYVDLENFVIFRFENKETCRKAYRKIVSSYQENEKVVYLD